MQKYNLEDITPMISSGRPMIIKTIWQKATVPTILGTKNVMCTCVLLWKISVHMCAPGLHKWYTWYKWWLCTVQCSHSHSGALFVQWSPKQRQAIVKQMHYHLNGYYFSQFWSYGSPPEEQQTFPEGPEGRCSFQKAASAILSHLHYLL